MAIPQVNITVQNGGLGIAPASSEGIQAKVGRISAAEFGDIASKDQLAVNTPTQFGSADAIIAACGTGVLAQAAILALQQGGGPVVVCRAADDAEASGSTSAVTFQTAASAAIDALKNASLDFEMVHVVCDADPASATSGLPTSPLSAQEAGELVTALGLKATAFWSAHRYDSTFFVVEMADPASNSAPSISSTSDFVAVCQGFVTSTNPITGATQKNPLAWHATARAAAVGLGIDLARVSVGPLSGVSAVDHDEAAHGGACDAAKLITGRTFPRHAGVYLTNGRMLSAEGSDIKYVQHRRVMNAACAAAYDNLIQLIGTEVPVDLETGGIEAGAAASIEANCLRAVLDRVGGAVTSASVAVDRTTNLLSTEEIQVSISIVPFGYLKRIEATIGFKNPALASA